ncbi:MAG: ferrous iron transporter B, partial [Methylomarinum sp.]|nr:ferrous iron transporter B [Methylomarinum sp.]
ATEKNFDFWLDIKHSFMTIPMGLKKMLGIDIAAKHDPSKSPFFSALHDNFHGQIGAYAYLLFVLLYFPCIATTSTAYKESNAAWSLFMVFWATAMAYIAATLFYQFATFSQHPGVSIAWGAGSAFFMAAVILGFLFWGKQQKHKTTTR